MRRKKEMGGGGGGGGEGYEIKRGAQKRLDEVKEEGIL